MLEWPEISKPDKVFCSTKLYAELIFLLPETKLFLPESATALNYNYTHLTDIVVQLLLKIVAMNLAEEGA